MGETDFETDFWKDAKIRKSWDELVPGEPRATLPYVLTAVAVRKYCHAVGDLNPLYLDEDYAKKSPYRGLIAPPSIHILLMFACTPTGDWRRAGARRFVPGRHSARSAHCGKEGHPPQPLGDS